MPKTPKELYLGIDPGKSGGLALLDKAGDIFEWSTTPKSSLDLFNFVGDHKDLIKFCVIERVGVRPGEGVVGAFSFGQTYGEVLMTLTGNRVPYELVQPRTWQQFFGTKPKQKTESKAQFKERLRVKSQELFPKLPLWSQKGTLGKQRAICDALLIAEFCRRRTVLQR